MRYFLLVILMLSASTFSKPSLEDYVLDATISEMELSPNGELIAFTKRISGKKTLVIMTISGEVISAFDVGEDKLRGYEFAGNDHLVMRKSITTRFPGYIGEYEYYGAIAINFRTQKSKQLLAGSKKVLYPQLRLDNILGPAAKDGHVLMAARSGTNQDNWTYDLYRVNLDTGKGKRIQVGKQKTVDWFIDTNEVIYAREDYDNKRDLHQVVARKGKKWEAIFSNEVEVADRAFKGLSSDKQSIVVIDESPNGNFDALYHLSLSDGTTSDPIMFEEGKEIDGVIRDWNGEILGVSYSGFNPSYDFYDEQLAKDMALVVNQLAPASVYIYQMSQDLSKVLLLAVGNGSSGRYMLFDRKGKNLTHLAVKRPEIPPEYTSKTKTLHITARDGLEIPTLVTIPSTVSNPKNLPAVVLPHGGPEAYDQVGFDYQVQYFASQGYVVIQPNFRGSTGFGYEHTRAGRGKWGKEMQDDLSDALAHFVGEGLVDPSKVCIVGASYGGYAALAGGAFTPDLYRCIVAIAPVTDLPRMLNEDVKDYGRNHWVVAYWSRVVGDRKEDREKLRDVSPVYHADKFTAPVLLIHGDDDTVVPIKHSKQMHSRLKKAGKRVTLLKLKNEDHWLLNEKTRIQSMKAISAFLESHLQ